jgi:four helix bundle suffix protein
MKTIEQNFMTDLIAKHGGYQNLKSFQTSEIIFDLTMDFCRRYIQSLKLRDQIEGAARGGKQNIAEGSATSGTSKQSEIRLMEVARASLEELLNDYKDFLRTNHLAIWEKDNPRAAEIRKLAYAPDRSYKTYLSYMTYPESAANCLICLIHQANFLLDKQLKALERDLKLKGDYKDRVNNFKKDAIVRNNQMDYDEFLKQFNLKRNENGTVSNINEL